MKGKKIAIDAYNAIYQFLAAIRQTDGTPLMDSKGRPTSHLSGIFYRTINIVESGIIPVYVFDGKPPEEKSAELRRRIEIKEKAMEKYEQARKEGEIRSMKKYAQMSSRLTNAVAEESKELLQAMGIPVLQAPSEGEAEAAYLTHKGYTWASASQDYDSLLFGADRLVRNLTLSGKRKLPNKDVYVDISPQFIDFVTLAKKLELSREQLIDIGILVGTDYNPEGVKGIGAKTALKIIKKYGSIENAIGKDLDEKDIDFDYKHIRKLFLDPKVSEPNSTIEMENPNEDRIREILVNEHDFNEDRVANGIARLHKGMKISKNMERQTGLDKWF
ncbi:Flap endonuclease 1 [Sulfuracidifex tepidarius]|uniref:Flap endonuclease 1 n=1 Tax=Sulfuracidifex tepidarius TaxID=1294262 RepID=A0A510DWE5_9CREN|nr:Flap endonuclease 1 [Sulfuracidifex tepidarius]BBG27339.1 Flap endonuclease 1 [Sulfuracidifex tepidarius]